MSIHDIIRSAWFLDIRISIFFPLEYQFFSHEKCPGTTDYPYTVKSGC